MKLKRLARVLSPCLPAVLVLGACASPPSQAVAACTVHCSTHDDGYVWAQSMNLRDAAPCDHHAAAFSLGCQEAVEDMNQLRARKEGL